MGRARFWFLAVGSLVASCAASINPAYKAAIDARGAALHNAGASYPAAEAFEPMPLAVGQWIELKTVDPKGRPGFTRLSVVGEQGGAYWLETRNESYAHLHETRMLVRFGDRSDPSTYEVQAFVQRVDGKLSDFPPGMVGMLKSLWRPVLESFVVQWRDLPRDDAQVIAGSFAGCFKRRSTFSWGPYTQTSDAWAHPAVPINGFVRSVGVDSPSRAELVAFGTEGAQSAF